MTGLTTCTCTCTWHKALPNCLDNGSREPGICEVGTACCMGSGVMGTIGGITKVAFISHFISPIIAGIGAVACCLGAGCPIPTCKFSTQQLTGTLPSSVAAAGQSALPVIDAHERGSAKCGNHTETKPESL